MYKYWLGAAVMALAGCASSYPTPTAHMAQAVASVGAAEADSAQPNLQVTRYLMRASEELSDARRLTDSGSNQRADFMFLRADADAKLAAALAREQGYEEGRKNAKGQAGAAAAQRVP